MSSVTATGKFMGQTVTVEAYKENGTIRLLINGEYSPVAQTVFNDKVKTQPPMGGTYYPEQNTLLCAYHVLENSFFEELKSIKVNGETEEIPFNDNQIY